MRWTTLLLRDIRFHARGLVATMLGVTVATAVLTGALLVGDSLRASLRAAALRRIGPVQAAVRAPRFFRADLARPAEAVADVRIAPLIVLDGATTDPEAGSAVGQVTLLGADERFWKLFGAAAPDAAGSLETEERRSAPGCVLSASLARELRTQVGAEIVVRFHRPAEIAPETLLGRRDEPLAALRLAVRSIHDEHGPGAFTLRVSPGEPRNIIVPLRAVQNAIRRDGAANTLVSSLTAQEMERTIQAGAELADFGLRLRTDARHGYVAVESETLLVSGAVEDAADATAEALGLQTAPVLVYLANSIAIPARGTSVPYSTVAALDPNGPLPLPREEETTAGLGPGEILLNDWAARELQAEPGDDVQLTYFVAGPLGRLETHIADFRLRGIVPLAGPAADPGFAPEYPGVTDARRMSDWDPPFPIDLARIRPQDEAYWDAHRATPKAFVRLADGVRLWAADHERFGRFTAIRFYPSRGAESEEAADATALARELRARLRPAAFGLNVEDVRGRALEAARGATDFRGLFLGFSAFLLFSAGLLIVLLFRFFVERRAREVGLLLAVGLSPRGVRMLILGEGLAAALAGVIAGLPLAAGYAALVLSWFGSWWRTALHGPELRFTAAPTSLLIGGLGGLFLASAALLWGLRGLVRQAPRALLAGVTERPPRTTSGRTGSRLRIAVAALLVILALGTLLAGALTSNVPRTVAFFAGGSLLLLGLLAATRAYLHMAPAVSAPLAGRRALPRLAVRNARRQPGRSLLTIGLVACATFVLTALQAMRLDAGQLAAGPRSGTGGFTLLAESTAPLLHDPNTPAGRRALGLAAELEPLLNEARVFSLRLRDGDETSCLNPYQPTQPRLLGAPREFIDRGAFAFTETLAETPAERENPWLLLRRTFADGALPAIADEAAALWQLHSRLGGEVSILDERGRPVRLRLVGLLKNSILQGELIVTEANFTRLFPGTTGYGFFLIEAPAERAPEIEAALERGLAEHGVAVTTAAQRRAAHLGVQNTYLRVFLALGGLGLLLGTCGLAAVTLRTVWERRAELALLGALGWSRRALGALVLWENGLLVVVGLGIGLITALLAVAPHAFRAEGPFPWRALALLVAGTLVTGIAAGAAGVRGALRGALLPALRRE